MKIMRALQLSLGLLLFLVGTPIAWGEAAPYYSNRTRRSSVFHVPPKLRPRVDFWIDVFTKYGRAEVVIHHRNFPQAVFKVLDFTEEAERLSEVKYARHRKAVAKKELAKVKSSIKHLSLGKSPRNQLERTIVNELSFMPRGTQKYKDILKKDLLRTQSGIKEKYAEAIKRSSRYLHVIERIFVKEYGLPIELTRLPFVESSFDYKAYSSAGAAGIWQFMRRTARSYMTVNSVVDERRDVVSSTEGAAKYLKFSYSQLGTWPLALTSYNHGVNGVKRKVKQAGTKDIVKLVERKEPVFGFASTNFYPEFLAALEVFDRVEHYFPGIVRERPLKFAQRELPSSISMKYLERELGIKREELQPLNYALSSKVWKGYYRLPKGYALKVPIQYGRQLANLHFPEPRSTRTAPGSSSIYGGVVYRVRRGDTLSKIARKYNTSVARLREYNDIDGDLLRAGEHLVVRPKERTTLSSAVASGTHYRVRPGDTLSAIASKYSTTVKQLQRMNGMRGTRIRIGQQLVVRSSGKQATSAPKGAKPGSYKVRRGDTLWSISQRFGITVSSIKRANKIQGNKITVGKVLKIP